MQRTIIDDLNDVDIITDEFIIKPETNNIHLLHSKTIEHLNLYSFNQKQFEKAVEYFNVSSLSFYEFRVEDLSPFENLDRVENLSLAWNTKAFQLWNMERNINLRRLVISDFSKLRSIELIKTGTVLESLELSGGIWTKLTIETLEPLSELKRLKQLTLTNIKVDDQSLGPLVELKNLEKLELSNQFAVEEYAKLSVVLTETKCDLFSAYTKLNSPIEDKDIMITGNGKPFLNSVADVKKIDAFETKFRKLQEQYRVSFLSYQEDSLIWSILPVSGTIGNIPISEEAIRARYK
ncbi:leucine-rich repeat domain-containing protein [Paenibacillus glycanilyticus]|uniref:Internalin n=1 Tax=Paenibacillus glycanilyticus TaxID=126569 RepID=A0ABQ6GP51_9BACL|nr:leucine-rich repeat domain-containing protein [Paenibacillus glycanilyticus]GLX71141.1 internalin [Paenibacillus glycanilyticus]